MNFAAGSKPATPLHDMRIRLTLDDRFVVRDIEVSTDAAPFGICPGVTPNFAVVKGLKIGPGWNKRVKQLLGGVRGCTHHVEMLGAMATVAFQTMWSQLERSTPETESAARPAFLDTCHALAADGPEVKKHWPAFYTGPADSA